MEGRGADYPCLTNIDLSRNTAALAASVPGVAVDPKDTHHVVVVWRTVTLADQDLAPGPEASQNWICSSFELDRWRHEVLGRGSGLELAGHAALQCPVRHFSSEGTFYVEATLFFDDGPSGVPGTGCAATFGNGGQIRGRITVDVIGTDTPGALHREFAGVDRIRLHLEQSAGCG